MYDYFASDCFVSTRNQVKKNLNYAERGDEDYILLLAHKMMITKRIYGTWTSTPAAICVVSEVCS